MTGKYTVKYNNNKIIHTYKMRICLTDPFNRVELKVFPDRYPHKGWIQYDRNMLTGELKWDNQQQ